MELTLSAGATLRIAGDDVYLVHADGSSALVPTATTALPPPAPPGARARQLWASNPFVPPPPPPLRWYRPDGHVVVDQGGLTDNEGWRRRVECKACHVFTEILKDSLNEHGAAIYCGLLGDAIDAAADTLCDSTVGPELLDLCGYAAKKAMDWMCEEVVKYIEEKDEDEIADFIGKSTDCLCAEMGMCSRSACVPDDGDPGVQEETVDPSDPLPDRPDVPPPREEWWTCPPAPQCACDGTCEVIVVDDRPQPWALETATPDPDNNDDFNNYDTSNGGGWG
jgi:hypothetical protein